MAKAVILFLSFVFIISVFGVSLSIFRDNSQDEQSNDFAPIVLSDDSFSTLKSQVSVDMLGKSILVQPVSFVVSKDTSSGVYVRACINFDGIANDARQKIAYESITAATPVLGKSYKWTRFGEYYYLCDSSNQLVALTSANSGEVFNLLEKEANIVPEDIVDEKFAGGEKLNLNVTLQSVQTSKVSSKNVEAAHSAFNAVETTLANTKQQCKLYFYDADGLLLGNQTVAYGKGVTIPTPSAQTGKNLIGWNTKSDYTGATLDEEDLSSVYEDLVLYAEFDALTYNVTVIQPTDELGNPIGTIVPGSTTIRYGQSMTFRVIPNTNYYIYGVYINDKNIGSVSEFILSGQTSDVVIRADISQEVIFLDINGGSGTQPRITFNEDKTKFVLSEIEPTGPSGKEFYYYSTNPLDNEQGQNGIRIDLGVEYPLSYLEGNKVLYAIYLTPTADYQTATDYIVVPKNVTSIQGVGENNMFGIDTSEVKFVTLPRSVKKIGNGSFRNLDGLTGLSMSTVVDSIGEYAFENCVSIEQFAFGPFINKIGDGAFKNCVSLSTLKNFENIPTTELVGTFENCAMLTNVTLPSVVTRIERTFKNCSNLLEVVLPDGLRNIEESTFENCASLSYIEIPSSVSFFGSKVFRNCVSLIAVYGLKDVVAIEISDSMFENCVSLQQLNIPSNTAVIGDRAFYACSALQSINNLSVVKVGEVCEEAFAKCTNLKELIFSGSVKTVGARAFADSGVEKVSLSQRLSTLGEGAFENCARLSSVQNLGIITNIPQNSFKNCSSLFSVSIPATVTNVGTLAFENCSSLTNLSIPASVQTIEVDALKNATGLKSITLQGDLASVYNLNSTGLNWYYNTVAVNELNKKGYYTTVVSDWIVQNINGQYYIVGYRGISTNVTIPYIITNEIGERTYIYGVALQQYTDPSFTGFENVVIEEGIQAIFNIDAKNTTNGAVSVKYPCFQNMTTLKSITLPSTLSSLSNGAFAGCSSLTEVVGLENTKITKLGDLFMVPSNTVLDYDDIITIDGIEYRIKYNKPDEIGGVFQETALKEIKLPANLQIIGAGCFSMTPIKEIAIPASVRGVGAMAFGMMENLESITGFENCILDHKETINGQTINCGFAAIMYIQDGGTYDYNYPIFYGLPKLKTLSLPSYATIHSGTISLTGTTVSDPILIVMCENLDTIILPGDWSQQFSLSVLNESTGEFGINSYKWYLNGKEVPYAMEAGTYTIFPGSDDSEWVVDENGMVIAYKGSNTTVTVPSSIVQNGAVVNVVGVKSFKNAALVNVTLSEGLTTIDAGAFANMTRLKNVKLSNSITTIGDGAFENCSGLVSVVLPSSTQTVGADVFKGCSSIKIIVLNSNITTEQNLANISDGEWFYQNDGASVVVSSMQTAGIYSKYSSVATTNEWEVKAYKGKNYITAYLGSSKAITVPVLVVESDYSKIYEIYGLLALKKFNFTSITVSEGIETLGLDLNDSEYAEVYTSLGLMDQETSKIYTPFMQLAQGDSSVYMNNLSTLILPDSLNIVGRYGLAGIKLQGTNTQIELKDISTLGYGALSFVQVNQISINMTATKTLSKIPTNCFAGSQAKTISIGYGPTTIESGAFSNCSNLTEINLPASVVTIEDGAFDGCTSIKELNLRNARKIGSISGCTSLEKIILGAALYEPYSATNISNKNGNTWYYEGGSAEPVSYFDIAGTYVCEMPDLSTIWTYEQIDGKWYITGYTGNSVNLTVPSSLTIEGVETAISGIKSITTNDGVEIETVVVSEGISEILAGALSEKTNLSSITLPSSLTTIGANAFSGTNINLLTLGCESLTLSAGALDGMDNLEIINVKNAVNSSYTLPSGKTWTYIDGQSASTTTTTLLNKGIYTTLSNVATTNEWIVGADGNSHFIAGYKLDYTDSSKTLEVPRLVINHKTFDVYEISSIKSLYMPNKTNNNVEITLKISEGITKIDTNSSSHYMTDVLGVNYGYITQRLENSGANNIVSIELPSTIFEIGSYAFSYLYNLREVINLENTQIKELKSHTFYGNNELTQLNFPITLKDIGEYNLSDTPNLNKIVLQSALNSSYNIAGAGNGIWYYNSETIKTVTMQKAGIYSSSPIQTIGLWVVELIDGKNYITGYLGGATELVVPHELFDEQQGEIVQIYGVRGIGKTDLTSITFEEGIEEVGEMSASGNIFGGECTNLSKISMPSTLTTIYDHALDNISAENIVITIFGSQTNAYTLSSIKDTTWYYGNANVTIMQTYGSYATFQVSAYMPDADTSAQLAGKTSAERNSIVTAAGYGGIDNAWRITDLDTDGKDWYMYGYYGSQSDIVVPHYVMDYYSINKVPVLREICNFMALNQDDLTQQITKITLEEGYTRFGGKENSTEVSFPGKYLGVETIQEVVLPSTLTKLGMYAFVGFVSLEKINLEETNISTITSYAFVDTIKLKTLVLPDVVKKIETGAFYGSGLVEFELNEGLLSMDKGSLAGLTKLKVLTIPSTISSLTQDVLIYDVTGNGVETLSSLEKIVIKKDLSTSINIEEATKNVYYKDGSQIALSTIAQAGTYLNYLCGTTDEWQYETSDGKNYITSYTGKNVVVDVPTYIWNRATEQTIEIYGVKNLNNSKIRKLTIREGIKSVGNGSYNIFGGSPNNILTYISLPYSLAENDWNILDGCNALESINLFGNLQTALTTSDIKQVTWHSHDKLISGLLLGEEDIQDEITTISLAGGYSTYSIKSNVLLAKPAYDGFGADSYWMGESGSNIDAFIPAFALYFPSRLSSSLIDLESASDPMTIYSSYYQIVPINSVITLRTFSGYQSGTIGKVAKYGNNSLAFRSLTFAEGITRIGDKGDKNNGVGSEGSLNALGPIVCEGNGVTKVGSEDKINLLAFDGAFDSTVPSQLNANGGTLSLSSTAYAGPKALSYSPSGASKATTTIGLTKGVYVFEAMVKSSTAVSPLQVQLSSGSGYMTFDSEVHSGSGNYEYIFVKFEVQSDISAILNLTQNAIYDCMSLYRVDRGLPTTLTNLGANAFAHQNALKSINLSHTVVEEIEMYALSYAIENNGLTYVYSDGKYLVNDAEVRVDWSFDGKTNTLSFSGQSIPMVETSEDMFWGNGYTFNAKTNRLTTPDGTYAERYFVQDGELKKDILISAPRTLKTLGFMALNTGATRIVGLEKSALKSMEVGAFGETIKFGMSGDTITNERFGENLVEINLPKTFEDITYSTSSDIALGPMIRFNLGTIVGGTNYHFPTNFAGYAFSGNLGLQNINVDSNNPVFSSKDGVLFNAAQTKIISFPAGRTGEYVMPESVTVVGEAAFMLSKLSIITVSTSLEEIQDYAFTGKTVTYEDSIGSISEFIDLENSKVKSVGRGAFAGILVSTLSFPDTLVKMGDTADILETPISGGYEINNSNLEIVITRSVLSKEVSLEYNEPVGGWYYNFSSNVNSILNAGIYSNKLYEKDWKVEEIDGKYWIVAYLGEETNLSVPSITFNDSGELVEVYGIRSLNYSNASSLYVAGGIKAFGYPGDSNNILGSTSDSNLASIEIGGRLESMTENSLMGLGELTCLNLARDLESANSFAPTGRTAWYHYNDGASEVVSTYQTAGIYTSSELQHEDVEWVVDDEGYIVAYTGFKTELVVPSHLLNNDNEVIFVKGIKSFKYNTAGNVTTLGNVTSVTLSEGLKTIEDSANGAFQYLTNVVEINLCSTLTYIGENAFKACEILEEITIPSGVKEVAVSALPMDKN
ncbi:MAG: leucine-rich repeat protein, partial [Christensenellales bacterium]